MMASAGMVICAESFISTTVKLSRSSGREGKTMSDTLEVSIASALTTVDVKAKMSICSI